MTIRTTTKREMQIQSKLMFLSQIFEERQFTGDVKRVINFARLRSIRSNVGSRC